VISISEINFVMNCNYSIFDGWSEQNFLENPIDIEMLWTRNANSIGDFNRAREELAIEISPVHLLVSNSRIERLSQIIPRKGFVPGSTTSAPLPPRLEVLAQFMLRSVDLRVQRLRMSLLKEGDRLYNSEKTLPTSMPEKQNEMREILRCFLSVAASFDLSFPHEESLSSAMQISIDRLTGLGISLEEAWEITNTALLNFLDDMAQCRSSSSDGLTSATPSVTVSGLRPADSSNILQNVIHSSADRTTTIFAEILNSVHSWSEDDIAQDDFVFDIPEGLTGTVVRMFYDSYSTLCIPAMFVTDAAGIHLLRVTSPEEEESVDGSDPASSHSNASNENVQDESSVAESEANFGIVFRSFILDKNYPFGRGGYSLSLLGTDGDAEDDYDQRGTTERIQDVEIGEVEVMFCRTVYDELTASLRFALEPFDGSSFSHVTPTKTSTRSVESRLLTAWTAASVLFTADDMSPFCRLGANFLILRKGAERDITSVAQSLSLINLTREGEIYPEVLSSLKGVPVHAVIKCLVSPTGPELDVELTGFRVVFLQQHLNELLQYFVSGSYGFGLFRKSLMSPSSEVKKKKSIRYTIELTDCSFLLPRSTISSDMVALEPDVARLSSNDSSNSFVMPTCASRLYIPGLLLSCDDLKLSKEDTEASQLASRVIVELDGVRIFTSLPAKVAPPDDTDTPSFRFLFSTNGRAEPHKPVYGHRLATSTLIGREDVGADLKNERVWQEVTLKPVSMGVLIDKAPHLRLLITDRLGTIPGHLDLDIKLSQFCLLLSLWYCNMQELPQSFPYHVDTIQKTARGAAANFTGLSPEHGTLDFQSLLSTPNPYTSEIAILFDRLSLRCMFDYGFFDEMGSFCENDMSAIRLDLHKAVVHVTNDNLGCSRIGTGSTYALFADESKVFERVVESRVSEVETPSWADLSFGLNEDYGQLAKSLPQAFQFSIFMTPGWSVYNVGLNTPFIAMSDFSSFFRLLNFVTDYFTDPKFGHPNFETAQHVMKMKAELAQNIGSEEGDFDGAVSNSTDFRLWLSRPVLSLPCDAFSKEGPGVRIECDGFWYRYLSMQAFKSHEIVSNGLELLFDNIYCAAEKLVGACRKSERHLIEGLSFGIRLDFNEKTNHSDISIEAPYEDLGACSIVASRINALPEKIPPERICVPVSHQNRFLGTVVCEITCIIDILPLVSDTILNLFRGPNVAKSQGEASVVSLEDNGVGLDTDSIASDESVGEGTFSVTAKLRDVRVFAFDPILGPHLPVAFLSVSSLGITASQFAPSTLQPASVASRASPPGDLQLLVQSVVWADYFKLGRTRSWEPLLEPFKLDALYEKSILRGSGLSVSSDTPFHLNISGALLVILDEVIDSFQRRIRETFGNDTTATVSGGPDTQITSRDSQVVEDSICGVKVVHELPQAISRDARVAFAFRNMTGQKLRLCKRDGQSPDSSTHSAIVSYVSHGQSTQLSFLPSISKVNNMSVIEVDFPGLSNSNRVCRHQVDVSAHAIDLQVPGFEWLEGIEADTFGRSFSSVIPRSQTVLNKITKDWRLANALKLLVEVGLQNGGRQVTVRSLFTVVNKTSHDVSLLLHPDPTYDPGSELKKGGKCAASADASIEPGEVLQVPVLLTENALHRPGRHLGSIWLRPDTESAVHAPPLHTFLEEGSDDTSGIKVDFTSRPVQLAKLVSESALLFESRPSNTEVALQDASTGVHVGCPVVKDSKRLPPYCYAVEVGRSPIVGEKSKKDKEKSRNKSVSHGPVAYTISIHPTFVIVNLLPEKGRFELMHAARRNVVWFADLEPGEQVSIHSVGLDAPLLLLLNLGFCKTPVGEGALVHHGVDPPRGARGMLIVYAECTSHSPVHLLMSLILDILFLTTESLGLKTIGKAGKAVTKQVGKALTKIGESPDKRGLDKLLSAQNPRAQSPGQKDHGQRLPKQAKTDLGLDTGTH